MVAVAQRRGTATNPARHVEDGDYIVEDVLISRIIAYSFNTRPQFTGTLFLAD